MERPCPISEWSTRQGKERSALVKISRRALGALVGILLAGLMGSAVQKGRLASDALPAPPPADKLIQYIRERFGLVSTIKLTLSPYGPAADPGYYQATLTVDDGKQTKEQPINVSKDGRYVVMGPLLPLNGNPEADIERQVREQFKVPANVKLTPGRFRDSKYAGFLETTVTASDGSHTQTQDFTITGDKRFLAIGGVYPLNTDPRREALRIISLKNQPGQGPANAPVTIVEYADLECPSCAHMQQFLENDIMQKYPGKVHIVFKEFPLPFHQWSKTAAIANECAYEMDPSKFAPYRSLIFEHQNDINAVQVNSSQVRELLLSYGQQVGLDRARLAVCLDSEASKPRVDAGHKEGDELQVASTPTFYINGKILVGAAPPETFYQAIEDALKNSK
jgi:protein-disulfide isomerase